MGTASGCHSHELISPALPSKGKHPLVMSFAAPLEDVADIIDQGIDPRAHRQNRQSKKNKDFEKYSDLGPGKL